MSCYLSGTRCEVTGVSGHVRLYTVEVGAPDRGCACGVDSVELCSVGAKPKD